MRIYRLSTQLYSPNSPPHYSYVPGGTISSTLSFLHSTSAFMFETIHFFQSLVEFLKLRYEMKFLVDGEWQISPEFPTSGEGMMENNVLVVE